MQWTTNHVGDSFQAWFKVEHGDALMNLIGGWHCFLYSVALALLGLPPIKFHFWLRINRIKIEVISVVAMQVLAITDALSKKQANMPFMGQTIQVNRNCGLFITMNPGYAGRTELPDNLKALMRPVAMMVPNLAMIAEVI